MVNQWENSKQCGHVRGSIHITLKMIYGQVPNEQIQGQFTCKDYFEVGQNRLMHQFPTDKIIRCASNEETILEHMIRIP